MSGAVRLTGARTGRPAHGVTRAWSLDAHGRRCGLVVFLGPWVIVARWARRADR